VSAPHRVVHVQVGRGALCGAPLPDTSTHDVNLPACADCLVLRNDHQHGACSPDCRICAPAAGTLGEPREQAAEATATWRCARCRSAKDRFCGLLRFKFKVCTDCCGHRHKAARESASA
jgi:hypothetical protein